MATISISDDNARFLQEQVDCGRFESVDQACNTILQEQRDWDEMVRERIAVGIADFEAGRYTVYDDESLTARFEELKARARQAEHQAK